MSSAAVTASFQRPWPDGRAAVVRVADAGERDRRRHRSHRRRRRRERDGVASGLALDGRRVGDAAVRRRQRHGHGRGAHELVAQALPVGDAVAVGRDDGDRRLHEDARVLEQERRRDRPLRLGGPVEQRPVEGHRRRAAAVERHAGDGAEPHERLGQLEVRHPDRVAGLAAVDGDEDDPPVRELADGAARRPRRQLARREQLAGAEDGAPSRTICGPPPIAETTPGPVRLEEEAGRHELADRRLRRQRRGRGPARDEHGAAGRDRHRDAARCDLDHRRSEVGVRNRGREREEDRRRRTRHRRGRRPPRLV